MNESIRVSHLSKQYRIGALQSGTTFRETVTDLLKDPFGRGRKKGETIWALSDVSFRADAGEVVGIIGRNGSGKSTLLKLLTKITYPTAGEVAVRGRVASLLEVGTGFHEELTGRENIYLNGSILGMRKKEIDAKLDAIISFADLANFIDTPIKRYSSGMHLRLGFAVAAYLDADVLFIDEVLAVGDVGFQKKCLQAMSDFRGSGRTILFVSHNLSAVENLCSRVIWIDGGRIRKDGNTRDVIAAYMATFSEYEGNHSDLRDIDGRGGSGGIRFTGIEFLDADRHPAAAVRSGDRLVVRLRYRAEMEIPSPQIAFAFRIYTEMGTLITEVSTVMTGTQIPAVRPGEGYLDVEIGFLNLMPARYYLSLWLYDPRGSIYDSVESRVALNIEPTDFYGSGRGITGQNGILFLPFTWSFEGMNGTRKKSAQGFPLSA